VLVIHRASLNARPACGAEGGKLSFSGLPSAITCTACLDLNKPKAYAVKCDTCKTTVRLTFNVIESYAGTICDSCKR